jgi:hypothetical protein
MTPWHCVRDPDALAGGFPFMPPPRLSVTLERAVRAEFAAALAGEPPAVAEMGRRVLNRITPPNWTLEWSLPGWLGGTLGLGAPAIASLTLANVLGLAFVKLQDDLLDGEIEDEDRPVAQLLAAVLHRKWLLVFARQLPGESRFWVDFESYMVQWAQATLAGRQGWPRPFADWTDEELLMLGWRGAPLKSCAVAACRLAHRDELIPQFEAALDRLLIGAVLLDHAVDWSDDLMQGRPNAFVAYCSLRPQAPAHQEENRRAVLAELTIGKGGQSYFRLLLGELAAAQALARAAGCGQLARYVSWLRRQTATYRTITAVAARDQLRQVVAHLLVAAETM